MIIERLKTLTGKNRDVPTWMHAGCACIRDYSNKDPFEYMNEFNRMQDDYLVTYCNTGIKSTRTIVPQPYWTTKFYSLGKHLAEYGYYPSWLPLCVYTDHGVRSSTYVPHKSELESDAPTHLRHSPESKSEWEKYSSKPCFVMYSPYVFYRRKNRIARDENATGTIAFPAHSTPSIDDVSDIEEYARQLLEMTPAFQPVSVCLHMHDINKGRHHIFEKFKIPVYTAGNCLDERFAERFYNIIKRFRFATSNMVGSYLFYCVEMGIPFSIYGNKQIFINNRDPNLLKGPYDPYAEFQPYRYVHDMFSGLFTEITPEQKEYVETALGMRDGLSRGQMARVLYTSLLKWIFAGTFLKHSLTYLRRWFREKNSRRTTFS